MTHDPERGRTKLYKWAIGLSTIYVADGALMAWALMKGGWAMFGYGQVSFIPVFIPAFLAGLVVSGIYVHGFMQRGWTARRAEWFFFFLFADAVAAKVVVIIHRHCCR